MTELFRASLTSLTVLTGATTSRVLDMQKEAFDAEAIVIIAPADEDGKTYTFEISNDGTLYGTLVDLTGTAVIVPAATKAILYNGILTAFRYLRLKASAGPAIDVTFQLAKSFRA